MARGKKITKKKLKEPDEFISFTQQAYMFIQGHLRKIAVIAGVIVAIALAIIFYRMWENKKEAEADRKLSLAMEVYQKASSSYQEVPAAEYKSALAKFEEVIKEYPGTAAGKIAVLQKGNLHLKLGDFDEALKAYQAFLDKAGHEKLYRLFALQGMGYAYEGKKDYAKAVEAYQQVIDLGETFQSGETYLSLGRCYEKLGKNQQALESYKAFLKTAKESETTSSVLRKVSLLEK